jgi:hypothetical protein
MQRRIFFIVRESIVIGCLHMSSNKKTREDGCWIQLDSFSKGVKGVKKERRGRRRGKEKEKGC